MELLDPSMQHYPWGSTTLISQLRGEEASTRPEAELWYGAHPAAPTKVVNLGVSLAELIAVDPDYHLGQRSIARFGKRLPFLLKVLAAGQPLSLQAHPSKEQAEQGFAHDNQLGLAPNAGNRNYKDDNHKPELLIALSEFHAMAGFRPLEQTKELLSDLSCPQLERYISILDDRVGEEGNLRALFTTWITIPAGARKELITALVERVEQLLRSTQEAWKQETCANVLALQQRYPGDIGVLGALLLNHIVLSPGQALYLGSGNLHAYISGLGVEIMANSDNVLRGGLTSKHVDVPELVKVLQFQSLSDPTVSADHGEYPVPVEDFRIRRLELDGDTETIRHDAGMIVLCTQGAIQADDQVLQPTQAVWVPAGQKQVALSGQGQVFLATV